MLFQMLGRVHYRRGNYDVADHMLKHMYTCAVSLYGEEAEHPTLARALVGRLLYRCSHFFVLAVCDIFHLCVFV